MTEIKPRRVRRSLTALTAALERAATKDATARAHYELGLFHDNNGREGQAIPHYREALELGLDSSIVPEALAWLASSLFKTGQPDEASVTARHALRLTQDPTLERFLGGLLRRIERAAHSSQSNRPRS